MRNKLESCHLPRCNSKSHNLIINQIIIHYYQHSFNHPRNIIKNLPGNISKRINTFSADETTFNDSKDLYNNALAVKGLKHKITFQKQQKTSTVTNKTKNRKWCFQQISAKNSLVFRINS